MRLQKMGLTALIVIVGLLLAAGVGYMLGDPALAVLMGLVIGWPCGQLITLVWLT